MTRRFRTRKILQRFLAGPTPGEAGPEDGLVGARVSKYRISRLVGRGGTGSVYEAEDLELRRRVALKILRPEVVGTQATVQRFFREASIAAQFQHPGIAPVYDVGTAENEAGPPLHFIAMAYVEGRTLAALLAEARPAPDEALRLLEDIALAVAYAHSKGVVHRDLKPQNVMIDAGGRVQLMDFGLAHASFFSVDLTKSQAVLGTPLYMAPEQVAGRVREIGPATDVYALGTMMYECLAGAPPFDGATVAELFHKILHVDPPALRSRNPAIGADAEAACQKAMEKRPERRYPGPAELAEDLGRLRRREPVSVRASGVLGRWSRRIRRRPLAVLAAAGALLFLLAGAVLVVPSLRRAQDELGRKDRELVAEGRRRAEALLDAVLNARRAGHLEKLRERAGELESLCTDLAARAPAAGEPQHLLGRLRRAELRLDEALSLQERALARNPGYAPALYEQAILGRFRVIDLVAKVQFLEILEGARGVADSSDPAPALAITAARARLAGDLEKLRAAEPGLGEAERAFRRGLSAHVDGRLDEARRHLGDALARNPFLDEAYEVLVRLEQEAGRIPEALAIADAAVSRDRGHAGFRAARAQLRRQLASLRPERATELLRGAVEDATAALDLAPGHPSALTARAGARHQLASSQPHSPARLAELEAAGLDVRALHRLNGGDAASGFLLGGLLADLVDCRARLGLDPAAEIAEALAALDKALRQRERCGFGYACRGMIHQAAGDQRRRAKQDPVQSYRAAIEDYTAAIDIGPPSSKLRYARGICHYQLGLVEFASPGGEAAPRFARAIADFDARLADAADDLEALGRRGMSSVYRAQALAARNEAPGDDWARAVADLARCLEAAPGRDDLRASRADASLALGLYEFANGGDPGPRIESALDDAARLIGKDPAPAQPHAVRGKALYLRARHLERQGKDALDAARDAGASIEAAVSRAPALAAQFAGPLEWIRGYVASRAGKK